MDLIASKEKLQLNNYKCVECHEEVLDAMRISQENLTLLRENGCGVVNKDFPQEVIFS